MSSEKCEQDRRTSSDRAKPHKPPKSRRPRLVSPLECPVRRYRRHKQSARRRPPHSSKFPAKPTDLVSLDDVRVPLFFPLGNVQAIRYYSMWDEGTEIVHGNISAKRTEINRADPDDL